MLGVKGGGELVRRDEEVGEEEFEVEAVFLEELGWDVSMNDMGLLGGKRCTNLLCLRLGDVNAFLHSLVVRVSTEDLLSEHVCVVLNLLLRPINKSFGG